MRFIVQQQHLSLSNNQRNNTTTTVQNKTKQPTRDKVQTKCKKNVSGSALQYRSAVQQPDCLGEEAVTQTGGAGFNASVALIGGRGVQR